MPLGSWMYQDPVLVIDRLRVQRVREQEQAERARRKKARRIKQLVKLAMSRGLRGQK